MPFNIFYNDIKVFYAPKLSMKHVSHLHIVTVYEFDLDMTLKWHLLTSNDLQFYSECYNCVLRPRNRYETCATLIFLNVLKSQKLKKREFGGHLGNDVIE